MVSWPSAEKLWQKNMAKKNYLVHSVHEVEQGNNDNAKEVRDPT